MTAASAELLRQRRDHQRRDVLLPGAHRGRRRPHRRPRDHRDPADPAARACRRSTSSCAAAVELAAGAPATAPVEYGLGPHAAYTRAAARAPRRRRGPPASTACCCTCTSPRPPPRAPRCWTAHGLSVPALLAAHGVLGGRVLAAHCVHMDDGDLELWRRARRRGRALPGQQRQAGQRRRAAARHARPRHPGRAWAPTVRRPTTALDLFADLRLAAQLARLAGRSTRPR